MRLAVFDIEANNLLPGVRWIWVVNILDVKTMEQKEWLLEEKGWIDYLDSFDGIIGHNIVGYDLPAIEKIYGWEPRKEVKVFDTLIMSQVLDYRRFGMKGHSLETWGEYLGYPKIEFHDFERFSYEEAKERLKLQPQHPKRKELEAYIREMADYCAQDTRINLKVWKVLLKELKYLKSKSNKIADYMRVETACARFMAKASLYGWPFDLPKALDLFLKMHDEVEDITAKLEYKLGKKAKPKDKVKGVVEVKEPKCNKDGSYNHHIAKWFGIKKIPDQFFDPNRLIKGPYCRVEFPELKLSSTADVKLFLYRNGWEPTQWNYKKEKDNTN